MIPLNLNKIWEELRKNTRRINSLQRSVDLINADREILETIQGRIAGLEEQIKLMRKHDTESAKTLTAEVAASGERIESKVEEIHDTIEAKKIIKTKPESLWQRLAKRLRG